MNDQLPVHLRITGVPASRIRELKKQITANLPGIKVSLDSLGEAMVMAGFTSVCSAWQSQFKPKTRKGKKGQK